MIAAIFWRLERNPGAEGAAVFSDVTADALYSEAVAWAAEAGIVSGYGNGKFGPEDPITREQLAVMLYRYAGCPETSGSLERFADADSASSYALNALRWAVEQGILTGKKGNILDPGCMATRAEVATILYRFLV